MQKRLQSSKRIVCYNQKEETTRHTTKPFQSKRNIVKTSSSLLRCVAFTNHFGPSFLWAADSQSIALGRTERVLIFCSIFFLPFLCGRLLLRMWDIIIVIIRVCVVNIWTLQIAFGLLIWAESFILFVLLIGEMGFVSAAIRCRFALFATPINGIRNAIAWNTKLESIRFVHYFANTNNEMHARTAKRKRFMRSESETHWAITNCDDKFRK